MLSERVIDILKDAPNDASEQLNYLLTSLASGDAEAFAEDFKKKFEGLDASVRTVIAENLKKLDINVLSAAVIYQLDSLRAAINVGLSPAKAAGGFLQGAGDTVKEWWKESGVNPGNWSPEARKYATIGIATAGVGIVAIGLYRGLRYFFFGSKKHREGDESGKWHGAVDTTKEAVSGVKGALKKALIFSGVVLGGLLAFFGIKYGYEMYEKFRMLGDLKSKSLEELTKLQVAMQKQISNLEAKGKDIPEELKNAVEEIRESIADKAATTGAVTMNSETQDAVKDAAEKTAEKAGAVLAAQYLVHFEDHPDISWSKGEKAETHEEKIVGILHEWMNDETMTMGRIFAAVPHGGVFNVTLFRAQLANLYTPPSVDEENNDHYLNSVELIVRACVRHRNRVEELCRGSEDGTLVDALTFREYIERLGSMNAPIRVLRDQIKLGLDPNEWNIEAIAQSLSDDPHAKLKLAALIEGSTSFKALGKKFTNAEIDLRSRLKNFSFLDVLNVINSDALDINPGSTVNQVRERFNIIKNKPPASLTADDVIALSLVDVVLEHLPSEEQLQPFFHNVFPNDTWVDPEEGQTISSQNATVIHGYIHNEMSFALASRLVQYTGMIDAGNPAGVALMQMEILKFIREKEPRRIASLYLKTNAYLAAINLGEGVISGEFLETLSHVFPNIDERLQLQIQSTLYAVAPEIFEKGLKAFFGGSLAMLEPVGATVRKHPTFAGTVATIALHRPALALLDWRMLRRDPYSVMKLLGKRGEPTPFRWVASKMGMRFSKDSYQSAHRLIETLYEPTRDLVTMSKSLYSPVMKRLETLLAGNFSTSDIAAFNSDVLKLRADAVAAGRTAKEISLFDDVLEGSAIAGKTDDAVRGAIRVTAHPFRGRFLSHGVPFLLEALGAYAALRYDIPLMYQYAASEREAQEDGAPELAEHYRTMQWKNYADLARDGGGGVAYYFGYKAIRQMAVSRAGGIPFRGAVNAARVGFRGTLVAAVAVEALFAEWQIILDRLGENLSDIELATKGGRGLSRKQLEDKFQHYKAEWSMWGWMPNSPAQFNRYYSTAHWIWGDTAQEMNSENEMIRRGLMEGYLFERLYQKAQAGDIFANGIIAQMVEHDGEKKPGCEVVFGNYITAVTKFLEHRFQAKNDITAITGKQGLESALRDADNYASMMMDVKQYALDIRSAAEIEEQLSKAYEEFSELGQKIALAPPHENISAYTQRRVVLEKQISEDQMKQGLLSLKVQWQSSTELTGGENATTIADLAFDAQGNLKERWSPQDLERYLGAYAGAKERMMIETGDVEDMAREYASFMTKAKPLLEQLTSTKLSVLDPLPHNYSYGRSTGYLNQNMLPQQRNIQHAKDSTEFGENTYEVLRIYYYLLEAYPRFDTDGALRFSLLHLLGMGWQQSGTTRERAEKFVYSRDAISLHYRELEARQSEFVPVDHSSDNGIQKSNVGA